MAFNSANVNFTEEELEAAAALDTIIEAIIDGLDFSDLGTIAGNVKPLYDYLGVGGDLVDKREIAEKIAYLIVALERDNDWI